MLFRSNDTATTEIYTMVDTLSLHDALPIMVDTLSLHDALPICTAVAAITGETVGVSKSSISISPAARDDRMKLAAVVKEVGAFCGIGAALLPLRNAGFFGGFSRTSRRDGKSGEEDIRIAD